MTESLARFHFLRPELLWLLVPWALGLAALVLHARSPSPWRAFIRAELLAHLEVTRARLGRFGPEALALALGAWAILCAAGPSYRAQANSGDPAGDPLIVVFELSGSMSKTDVSPSRAERARLELLDLLRARPASPTALVVVAGTAHVLMPFTDDVGALEPYVEALSPELMPSDGQDFSAAAKLVERLSGQISPAPAVLLVSDGVPATGAHALSEFTRARGLSLITLRVGGDDVEASALNGISAEVIDLSYSGHDVPALLSAIANARAARAVPSDARFWQDEGPSWAWLLLVGVALWFRRGFVLQQRLVRAAVVGASALVLGGCSPLLAGIWFTPDQQGRFEFERGNYLEAAARFEDPTWKALSYYAAEKWDAAAAAVVGKEDADSLFLLGNAYAEGGKLQSAVYAYDRALQKRPTFRAARENRDRVDHLLHSLQEDTDEDDLQKVDQGSDDAATQVDPDALAKRPPPQSGTSTPTSQAGALEAQIWLERLSTDPATFLKQKLAVQAARGTTQPSGGAE